MAMTLQSADSVTYDAILAAQQRIRGGVQQTSCVFSPALSARLGAKVWCKLEYQQVTGSFKERGARNALLLLDEPARRRGVVAASAGNHALALAYHGRDLAIPITVCMPKWAPLIKQERCRSFGANVILAGDNIAEARIRADEFVARDSMTYINGFDDAAIIAGAGTTGIEIVNQVPDLDAIVCPIGGGGLIAGIAVAVRELAPRVEIIGVEPERAASWSAAIAAGKPVMTKIEPTLADGLAVPQVGERAFAIARSLISQVVRVGEDDIALAIVRILEEERGVVEGGGAAPLAALIANQLPHLAGKKIVLVLGGGNIDPSTLSRVIEHGLAVDGRVVQFSAMIGDRPGGLAHLATLIAQSGASVKQIMHDRTFAGADVSRVQVVCQIEVRGRAHADELYALLSSHGISILSRTAESPTKGN
ncbi:MAG: pyridoxal-phosphate dependent enzyme [Planctomycetota bacterium]|nr:pyridoxal-phosphate dependent enzyme [Planctomycetota bacterium]